MKALVVGLGAMGKNHARIYSKLGILDSVYDVQESISDEIAIKYKCITLDSLDTLIAYRQPDIISICTPTEYHFQTASTCLKYTTSHILLEKPISNNLEEARSIVQLAKETNIILGIGYIERYNPVVQSIKKLIEDNAFGEITSINIKRVGGWPRSAKNVVVDLMTHDFNILLGLLKKMPSHIYSVVRKEQNDLVNSAQVLLDFDGISAMCESNWISPIKQRTICITGTKGYCEADLIKQTVTTYNTTSLKIDPSLIFQDFSSFQKFVEQYGEPSSSSTAKFCKEPLEEEIIAFIDAITYNNLQNIVLGQEAIDTLKITLQAAGELIC